MRIIQEVILGSWLSIKEKNETVFLHHNTTNINFRYTKDLNGSGRFIEGGLGKYLYDLEIKKDFTNKTQRIQTIGENINNLSILKFKAFMLPISQE